MSSRGNSDIEGQLLEASKSGDLETVKVSLPAGRRREEGGWEEGREEGREGGRERGREGGWEGGREVEREGGSEVIYSIPSQAFCPKL